MRIKKGIYLCLMCFLTIGFIFFNSSQTSVKSNARSYRIAEKIVTVTEHHEKISYIIDKTASKLASLEKIDTNSSIDTIWILNLFIRKCAHAFEFFLLASILFITFYILKIKLKNRVIYSLFIVLLSAVCDEFLQVFIIGRNSSVIDILIDFSGGVIACIVFICIKLINILIRKYK